MQPLLKWAGGKRWLAPTIAEFYQDFTYYRFVEPFAGGLAAAWHIEPTRCLANDLNGELINFYNTLQITRKQLESALIYIELAASMEKKIIIYQEQDLIH